MDRVALVFTLEIKFSKMIIPRPSSCHKDGIKFFIYLEVFAIIRVMCIIIEIAPVVRRSGLWPKRPLC
jgi:hypothetical protein